MTNSAFSRKYVLERAPQTVKIEEENPKYCRTFFHDVMTKHPRMYRPRTSGIFRPLDDVSHGRCAPERYVSTVTIDKRTAAPLMAVPL
jgi:hypothetical protein